jgi:hypothetical protein
MLSEMGANHFWEWVAFAKLEPFTEERADLRTGIIASTIANIHRGKRRKAYKPKDFMPQFTLKREQSWEEQLKIVEMLNFAFGGKDERVKQPA